MMAEPSTTAQKLIDHARRIESLETWRHETDKLLAVRSERDKHMDERFDRIEKSIDGAKIEFHEGLTTARTDFKEGVSELKGDTKKLVWLIVAAIVGGIMQFIIRGGLFN